MSATESSSLARTTVADTMHEGVYSCPPEATLSEVAEIMAARSVHAVVVHGSPDGPGHIQPRLFGLITDLDLIAAATVRDLDKQAAGGSAGGIALTIAPSDTLEHAAQLMTRYGISHLVVVEPGSGRHVGVISTLDIVNALARV